MNRLTVIIPVMGQGSRIKEFTKICLDSFYFYSPPKTKLILVSNGSDKENLQQLESYSKADLIVLAKPAGYTKATNIGLQRVDVSDFIVLANNDLVFTPNWAGKMMDHFEKDSSLGLLGPTTNMVEGYQHIGFNRPGVSFQYSDALTFFLAMIRRETFDKVGLLDERFNPGGQEDGDYARRVREMGWKVGIARNVFLYHYGSGTFRELMDASQSRVYAKSRVDLLREKYGEKMIDGAEKKKKIFIAIPNLGSIVPGLSTNLIHWSHDSRYQIQTYMPEGICPLDAARNQCVKKFLETDADFLWFLDSDIVPPLDTMHRLVLANKDAIGAVCFSMKAENGEYFPYPVTLRYNKDMQYTVYCGHGVEEMDATGGACVLFSRKVFETIEKPYEFLYYPDGTLKLTCDFYIFQKIQRAGFKLFIDFGILCDHQKKCSIKGFQDCLAKVKHDS